MSFNEREQATLEILREHFGESENPEVKMCKGDDYEALARLSIYKALEYVKKIEETRKADEGLKRNVQATVLNFLSSLVVKSAECMPENRTTLSVGGGQISFILPYEDFTNQWVSITYSYEDMVLQTRVDGELYKEDVSEMTLFKRGRAQSQGLKKVEDFLDNRLAILVQRRES